MERPRLLRITTVPVSLQLLLKGQFRFMEEHGFEVLTASADGPGVAGVRQEGVRHVVIPFTRKITPFRDFVCLIKLTRLIRRFRPDIVHTHTPKAGLLGMMAAWACRVRVRMHTVAGLPMMEANGFKRFLLTQAEKMTYRCATAVYPNSHSLMEFLKKELRVSANLKIIGKGSTNGIDPHFFQRTEELLENAKMIRARLGIGPQEVVFSFVGRLVKEKGIVELVIAFRKLAEEFPIRLLLVGDFEDDRDPLPEDVKIFLRSDDRVILAGFQSDVRPWFLASDVFAFPSYREGFPNVVMQAACLGIPCIVSDINGCNEIIHSDSGILIPAKDPSLLYGAMKALCLSPDLREKYSWKAREYIVTNFAQQTVWQGLLHEYKMAITR